MDLIARQPIRFECCVTVVKSGESSVETESHHIVAILGIFEPCRIRPNQIDPVTHNPLLRVLSRDSEPLSGMVESIDLVALLGKKGCIAPRATGDIERAPFGCLVDVLSEVWRRVRFEWIAHRYGTARSAWSDIHDEAPARGSNPGDAV